MDAEDFYESRRLKEEEMADKFDERKAHEMAFWAREIEGGFAFGFAGKPARLPRVYSMPRFSVVRHDTTVAEAVADAVSLDGDPMRLLLEACRTDKPNLHAFKEACVKAYLNEHLDDIAECEIERQDREGME